MHWNLITGGAGFIGSHLVEQLVKNGKRVRVLDNLTTGTLGNISAWMNQIEFVHGDIRDPCIVKKVMSGVEHVFHHAALHSIPKSMTHPQEYHDVNVGGTLQLMLAARTEQVRRFIFASSCVVYGGTDTISYHQESRTGEPLSPYAVTKAMGEAYVRLFAKVYGLCAVSLRYFNVFGPRQNSDDEYAAVIPKFIRCFMNNERPPIYGDGNQSRDFVYIDNVVDANLAACTGDVNAGEAINVADGTEQTVLALAQHLAHSLNIPCRPLFEPSRAGDLYHSRADVGRLLRLVPGGPRISFADGLAKTLLWFQMNHRGGQG